MPIDRLNNLGWIVLILAVVYAPAPALAADCTLADHIRSANTNTSVGGCPAGTSHDVISISEDIVLSEPLPPITGTITIEGGGHSISGDGQFPILYVERGRLTVNNLTLTEGNSIDHRQGFGGSAIGIDRGVLAVNNSNIVGNTGSAIVLWRSRVEINGSSFVANRDRNGYGGAIFVGQGVTLDVNNSTFSGNIARNGGSAIATRVSTFSGIVPSSVTLTHVTIVPRRGLGRVTGFSILVDENDRNFKLRNSLITGTKGPYRKEGSSCHGPLSENNGNFIEDGSCASVVGGDPMLAVASAESAHFDLLDGSPALDAADARFCLEADQLGTPRPHGEGCDIGAIESRTARPAPAPIMPPPPCPLADQITAANTDAPAGGCPAGSGHDVIRLSEDIDLDAPLPPITSEITIAGNGHTLSGAGKFRILEVDGGALTLGNVTLTGGKASRGGAILLRHGGRALVADVTFIKNSAFFGGAIATESAGDQLTVSASSFINNAAETSGGAIAIEGGSADISRSAFQDNRAQARGGAIAMLRGRAAISHSTVTGNAAVEGGGIYAIDGEITLTHLTVMNNHAEHILGAGIYAEGGAVSLRNSIVAGSGSGDDCSGALTLNRGSFSQDGSCAALEGGDPMVAAVTGSPAYHELQDSSPAHGAADPAFCLETDQLGNPRTHCDIGAIESARDSNYVATPRPTPPAECTLADQIIAANTDAPAGACPAGDGADVINLRKDVTLRAPLPTITSDIAFDGNGHTISGDNRFRIFDIESGNVVFKRITLADGRNVGKRPEGYGGAITLRNNADLILYDATFRDNSARMGGAVATLDASHLYIFESRFYGNEASGKGGALWRDGACGYIYDVVFRRNIAGDLPGTINDDYFTHMDGGASPCTSDAEVYTLSDN